MSGSGYTCIRRTLCWLNVLLWLAGGGILGAGLWLRFGYEGYISLLPQYALLSADVVTIIVGAITIFLAFFGCCGSWFHNRCMLITYFSCIILMFEIEFFFGTLAFIFRERLTDRLQSQLQYGIKHHYNITTNGPDEFTVIWDRVNTEFRCCGVVSASDWYNIDAWPNETWVPDSCCITPSENCGRSYEPHLWYARACSDQVRLWFIQRLHLIGVIGLVVSFIQLFGLISSMLLFCTVKRRRFSETYTSFDRNM